MSGFLPSLPPAEVRLFENLKTFAYFDVASIAILAYDYLLTFPAEVRYIWSKPLSPIALLFFTTRYLPFADNSVLLSHQFLARPSPSVCTILYNYHTWSYIVGITVADIALILRTAAIWGNSKPIVAFSSALLAAIFISASYFVNKFLESLVFVPSPALGAAKGCFVISVDNVLYVCYAVLLVFETAILLLTLLKVNSYLGGSFANSLYRDSVAFYFYLFALSVTNIVVLLTAAPELGGILTELHRVIHSILSGRIILHIRQAASHRMASETGEHITTFMFDEAFRAVELSDLSGSSIQELFPEEHPSESGPGVTA